MNLNQNYHSSTSVEPILSNQISNSENQLIVVMFYGTIALGKSTFKKRLEFLAGEQGFDFFTLSKDDCCVRVIREHLAQHPEKEGSPTLFIETMDQSAALFDLEFKRIIEKEIKPGKSIFLIDHGRMDQNQLDFLSRENLKPGFDSKLVAIYPESSELFYYTKENFVPFSGQLLLNLCDRVVKRMFHETIVYEDSRRIHLALSYVMTYTGVRNFENSFFKEAKWAKMIAVPFHKEKKEKNDDLNEALEKLAISMNNTTIFDFERSTGVDRVEEIAYFLNDEVEYEKLKGYIQFAQVEDWDSKIEEVFQLFN